MNRNSAKPLSWKRGAEERRINRTRARKAEDPLGNDPLSASEKTFPARRRERGKNAKALDNGAAARNGGDNAGTHGAEGVRITSGSTYKWGPAGEAIFAGRRPEMHEEYEREPHRIRPKGRVLQRMARALLLRRVAGSRLLTGDGEKRSLRKVGTRVRFPPECSRAAPAPSTRKLCSGAGVDPLGASAGKRPEVSQ